MYKSKKFSVQFHMLTNQSKKSLQYYERKLEREEAVSCMSSVILSWTKEDMKIYLYNNNKEFPCSDAGMEAILKRFINLNEFQIGQLAEELKLGFDLVLSISKNSKISFETTELIALFIKTYKDVIHSYDRQAIQTYNHKLKQAYDYSLKIIDAKLKIEEKLRLTY